MIQSQAHDEFIEADDPAQQESTLFHLMGVSRFPCDRDPDKPGGEGRRQRQRQQQGGQQRDDHRERQRAEKDSDDAA